MRDQSTPKPLRCAIYVRVSTSMQEDNTSLDTQENRCRAYANEQGWEVAGTFRETHTGAELWERPKLTEVRGMIRDGAIDVLLCYALDRLSRKQTHIAIVAEEIERAGGSLAFVTEDFEHSAVGTFLRGAKAFAAELEREKIAERTQRGLRARAESGKMRPGCRVPYGYQWRPVPGDIPADVARKLARAAVDINPDTAPIVERIFSEVAAGATLRGLAQRLTDAGIPTATGAGRWQPAVLRAICHNPMYTGVAYAHRRVVTKRDGKRHYDERPLDAQIALPAGTVPAIVSADLARAAQERLARNQREASRNNHSPQTFLLRGGFIIGGCCGNRVHTDWVRDDARQGEKRAMYRVRKGASGHDTCPNIGITAATLDAAVWEGIKERLGQEDIIATELARLRANDPTAADRTSIERLLTEATRKQKNLTRALADIDDDDVRAGILGELKAVSQRVRDLEGEREAVAGRRASWEATQTQLDKLNTWLGTVRQNLDALDYDQRRDLLTAIDLRVTLYPATHAPRYTITASLPFKDGIVYATPRSDTTPARARRSAIR